LRRLLGERNEAPRRAVVPTLRDLTHRVGARHAEHILAKIRSGSLQSLLVRLVALPLLRAAAASDASMRLPESWRHILVVTLAARVRCAHSARMSASIVVDLFVAAVLFLPTGGGDDRGQRQEDVWTAAGLCEDLHASGRTCLYGDGSPECKKMEALRKPCSFDLDRAI
jgi:hypothetical protein